MSGELWQRREASKREKERQRMGVSGPEGAERDGERQRDMGWGLKGKNKAKADCLCFGKIQTKKIFTMRKKCV